MLDISAVHEQRSGMQVGVRQTELTEQRKNRKRCYISIHKTAACPTC
jgi:hypothetical protein